DAHPGRAGLWRIARPPAPGRPGGPRPWLHGAPSQITRAVKRWAALTVALYALTLLVLSVPGVLVAFGTWAGKGESVHLREAIGVFAEWGYWVWLVLMATAQVLLLVVPVRIASKRPVSRRSLLAPILTTGFFFGHLVLMALTS